MDSHTPGRHAASFPLRLAMLRSKLPKKGRQRLIWGGAIAFCIGITISFLLWQWALHMQSAALASRFQHAAQLRAVLVQQNVERDIEALENLTQLFLNSASFSNEEFQKFSAPFLKTRPSITALDWAPRIHHRERGAMEVEHSITIKGTNQDGESTPLREAEYYFPILFTNPTLASELIGRDHYSQLPRAGAMVEAASTHQAIATAPIRLSRLPRKDGAPEDFLVFFPVFKSSRERHPTSSIASSDLKGFVVGVFRMSSIVNASLSNFQDDTLEFQAQYESNDSNVGNIPPSEITLDTTIHFDKLVSKHHIQVAEKSWTLTFTPTPSFVQGSETAVPFILFLLSVFSTLALITQLVTSARKKARLQQDYSERLQANVVLKQQERALVSANAFNTAVLFAAGHALISVDLDGRIETFNPAAEKLLGYTPSEVIGLTPQIFHDRDEVLARSIEFSKELNCEVHPGFETFVIKSQLGLPNEHEWTFIRKDGSRVPVILSITSLRDNDGEMIGYLGLSLDISVQKELRRELENRSGQLQAFIEHAPAAVAMFDQEMRYVAHSRRWSEDYHLAGRDIIGLSHYEVFPEIGDEWKQKHQNALNGIIDIADDQVFERADGTLQWLKWEVRPWYLTSGEIGGITMLTEDVTSRNNLMESFRVMSETAMAATAAKSQFLANMSHEIRTPLTSIIGFAECILTDGIANEEHARALATIHSNGIHLLEVINDILDLSKIDAGALNIEALSVSPVKIIEDVRQMMIPRVAEKSLALMVNYQWPLPKSVFSDPLRLKQVFVNLVGNAIKFTNKGRITISVCCDRKAEEMEFRISDTGIGLTSEQLSGLFKPFSQAEASTTRIFGGSGLGLSVSKQLVERFGGQIKVESEPGSGSCFIFSIATGSLQDVELIFDVPAFGSEKPVEVPQEVEKLTGHILIAEDARDNRKLLEYTLKKTGITFAFVENGQEAVTTAMMGNFDMILMDMQMPVMDGYAATRELRKRGLTIPIVAFTANTMKHDIINCVDAGCTSHLAKPFNKADFLQMLLRQLPNS